MSDSDLPATSESDSPNEIVAAFESVTGIEGPDLTRPTEDRSISISKDITDESTSTDDYKNFERYFNDRFRKLRKILGNRHFSISPIARLNGSEQDEVAVAGIVYDKGTTSKQSYPKLTIEDSTGTIDIIVTNEEAEDAFNEILLDDVIVIKGNTSDDASVIWGNEIYFPDVPPQFTPNKGSRPVEVVLISDTHMGSTQFSAKKWRQFVQWISGRKSVEYLLIAGDLVEGIGVYPGQKEELVIPDIEKQYKLCGEALAELPNNIDIIVTPGNHDAVRLAEPQPAIREEFQEYFPSNVQFTGNPSMITLEGVNFLLYHGMSLNPIINRLPGMDIQNPAQAMKPLLKKRHLSVTWGEDVQIAPETEDHLVIDTIPDVFHTGHTHTFEVDTYHNVKIVNTGTWQERTDFQRSKNVYPDVGYGLVVNLDNLKHQTVTF